MDQAKVRGPPFPRVVIAFGEHADRNRVSGPDDRLKLPHCGAHESVRWSVGIVCFISKPGEADGHASPNGAVTLPLRPGAEEKHFLGASWLPGGDVRTMQVHLTGRCGRGDAQFSQP